MSFWIDRVCDRLGWPPGAPRIGVRRQKPVRILALMKDNSDFSALSHVAIRMKWNLMLLSCDHHIERVARSREFAIILCDRDLTENWKECLDGLVRSAPHSAIILLSDVNDSYLWEEVTMRGGYDVLAKPLSERTCTALLSRAVTYWRLAF